MAFWSRFPYQSTALAPNESGQAMKDAPARRFNGGPSGDESINQIRFVPTIWERQLLLDRIR
jgi:hypothetical protein